MISFRIFHIDHQSMRGDLLVFPVLVLFDRTLDSRLSQGQKNLLGFLILSQVA